MDDLTPVVRRVERIDVEGLFGVFDHSIPIRLDAGITIIHGPNGYGKTVVLSMLAGLLTRRLSVFSAVPFHSFSVSFTDGLVITISKRPADDRQLALATTTFDNMAQATELLCVVRRADGSEEARTLSHQLSRRPLPPPTLALLEEIDHYVPAPFTRRHSYWIDRHSGLELSLEEVLERFAEDIPDSLADAAREHMPSPLSDVDPGIPVTYIKTQRLADIDRSTEMRGRSWNVEMQATPHDRGRMAVTVERYSGDIALRIRNVLATYAATSQELDRTFPRRLLTPESPFLPAGELQRRFGAIEDKRQELIKLGILDPEQEGLSQPPTEVLEKKADVLSVYLNDVQRKFSVFDDIYSKLRLFKSIVNRRLRYKRLRIGRNKTFEFVSAIGIVPARSLSSGEQHELVLLYELLFKVKNGGLVLIDEPEISLHPGWQKEYLQDLKDIVALSGFDVVLATHSPIIIGPHWDLTVELAGPPDPMEGFSD